MKIKAIACGVFLPYLEHLAARSPHEVVSASWTRDCTRRRGNCATQLQME